MPPAAAPRSSVFSALLARRFQFGRGPATGGKAGCVRTAAGGKFVFLLAPLLAFCVLATAGCADVPPKPQMTAVTPAPRDSIGAGIAAGVYDGSPESAVTPAARSDSGAYGDAAPGATGSSDASRYAKSGAYGYPGSGTRHAEAGSAAYAPGSRGAFGTGAYSPPDDWSAAEKQAAIFICSAPIYFHYDSFALTDSAKAVLGQKAAKLKEFPAFALRIGGYCDERGSAAYNDALGGKRARAALEYLVTLGIARARLETVSYGNSHPLVPGSGENVWSQNRRDEFSVNKNSTAYQ